MGVSAKRGRVLYLSAEDDLAYTIRPRIDAMGGDAKRIRVQADYLSLERLRTAARDPKKHPELAKLHKPRAPWNWIKGSAGAIAELDFSGEPRRSVLINSG